MRSIFAENVQTCVAYLSECFVCGGLRVSSHVFSKCTCHGHMTFSRRREVRPGWRRAAERARRVQGAQGRGVSGRGHARRRHGALPWRFFWVTHKTTCALNLRVSAFEAQRRFQLWTSECRV